MKRSSKYIVNSFEASVEKALQSVKRILDTTRQPQMAHSDEDHKYDDKFALAEFLVNTAIAAQMNALERLGLNAEKLQTVAKWVYYEKQSVTLRFEAEEACTFLKENIVPLANSQEVETRKQKGGFFGSNESTETVITKVVTKIIEHHWKVRVKHRLFAFKGSDPNGDTLLLQSRDVSTILITSGGQAGRGGGGNPRNPLGEVTRHSPVDLNLTWMVQQISPKDQLSQFFIDLTKASCKTPRRNDEVDQAVEFELLLKHWTEATRRFLVRVDKTILGIHKPTNTEDAHSKRGVSLEDLHDREVFVPVIPLLENGSVLSMGDVNSLLEEQTRSLDAEIASLATTFPPQQVMKLVSVLEAKTNLMCMHLTTVTSQVVDGLTYIEKMLEKQLIQAIGKTVGAEEFGEYIQYHYQHFFAEAYAPRPYTYAVRRPDHYPDGMISIEKATDKPEPIYTWVRHIPASSRSSIYLPISAATSVELRGDCYLHGWLQHRFGSMSENPESFRLAARARQFSSFLLVVGNMMGPNKLNPKDAIILQNKDEVLIPLLTNALPSAKDFKDAIYSLSPEQQAFAKSFRSMQLESSVFGVCIIQLKPQFERLLGLPDGSLTKEIQLTQDLMSLFLEYQIPSDLLSFREENGVTSNSSDKVAAVKGYVKAVMDVIESDRKKQLEEEKTRADMRTEMNHLAAMPMLAAFSAVDSHRKMGECYQDDMCLDEASFELQCDDASIELHFDVNNIGPVYALSCPVNEHPHTLRDMRSTGSKKENLRFESRTTAMPTAESGFSGPPMVTKMSSLAPKAAPPGGQSFLDAEQNSLQAQPAKHNSRDGVDSDTDKPSDDFTSIPKLLDTKLEAVDKDNALRSTTIKTADGWARKRQKNLLVPPESCTLQSSDVDLEKKKAFDLLDAISRSGVLPIECAELHVVVAVSHCFENNVMGTVIQENVNPIHKMEKSSFIMASTIHGETASSLLQLDEDATRLVTTFPELTE